MSFEIEIEESSISDEPDPLWVEEVDDLAQMLFGEYKPEALNGLEIVWTQSHYYMGRAWYMEGKRKNAKLEFSALLFRNASEKERHNTIIHEICHILAGSGWNGHRSNHHGYDWQHWMIRCGENPQRCHNVSAISSGNKEIIQQIVAASRRK